VDTDATDPSAGSLISALDIVVGYESRWKEVVAPKNSNHPLLLPPPSFAPHREISDYWWYCDCYRETAKIDRANTVLQKVHARHRRSRSGVGKVWIDNDERQFVIDPSRHGLAAGAREGRRLFRFAFEVAADIHYDVTHGQGKSFRITDRFGTQIVVTRANVNPWGDVRPATTA
jgi:hypothetical protein